MKTGSVLIALSAVGHAQAITQVYDSIGVLPANEESSLSRHLLVVSADAACADSSAQLLLKWDEMDPNMVAERDFAFASGALAGAFELDAASGVMLVFFCLPPSLPSLPM